MKKKKKSSVNADGGLTFIYNPLSSFATCDSTKDGCKRKSTIELKIKDHPEADRKTVCDNKPCLREAKTQLAQNLKNLKMAEAMAKN